MKNPERVWGREEEGGAEEKPGARDGSGGGQREKIYNGQMGDKKFGDERAALAEAGLDCTVEVYMSEESEEGVTVIFQGAAP